MSRIRCQMPVAHLPVLILHLGASHPLPDAGRSTLRVLLLRLRWLLLRMPTSPKSHPWRRSRCWESFEFRSISFLRSCRCKKPAQDYVRLLRWISFAKIVILDFAHGIILPNRRRPEYISNCCDSALFEELCSHHGVLLVRNLRRQD